MKKVIVCILFAAALAGCSSNNDDGPARLSIAVTDSPVDDADAVVVTFTGLELLGSDDGVRESFTFAEPISVDLLQFQGDQSRFLIEGEEVPVGVYDQVRLIVDTENASCNNLTGDFASYITIDGTDYPLVVPSGGASGLKVMGPITVAQGGTAAYTIDFDVRKAIAERGATGCYNLKPVLRVVDNAEVGTLTGTVDAELLQQAGCTADAATGAGAAVYVYQGSGIAPDDVDGTDPEPLTSSLLTLEDDGSGDFTYEVGFLLAGDYTAAFSCQAGDDTAEGNEEIAFTGAANVAIAADEVTTQNFSLTPEPTPTPAASATPAPTESPEPTATPTESPAPTESPEPTATPTPSP
ncbi:MAG: DUF4382 domain-containing protein [Sinimarinibacterium sp.]|jgi:hypothetical protein